MASRISNLIRQVKKRLMKIKKRDYPNIKGWTLKITEWEDDTFIMELTHGEENGKVIEIGYYSTEDKLYGKEYYKKSKIHKMIKKIEYNDIN